MEIRSHNISRSSCDKELLMPVSNLMLHRQIPSQSADRITPPIPRQNHARGGQNQSDYGVSMHRTWIRRNWGQEVRDSRRTATLGAVAVSSSFVVAVRPVGCVGKRIIIRLASPKASGQGRELSLLTAIS